MTEDFFIIALIASFGCSILTGLFGCFVVWRSLAYYGETISHASILGIVIAFMFRFSPMLGVLLVAVALGLFLHYSDKLSERRHDSILGVFAHGSLALGILSSTMLNINSAMFLEFLFNDILTTSIQDLIWIYSVGSVCIIGLLFIWKGLIAIVTGIDIATAEGFAVKHLDRIFFILLSVAVAVAVKVVGVLLATSLFIIPAISARSISKSPEHMAVISCIISLFSTFSGLFVSLYYDLPTAPSIVLAACSCFVVLRILKFIQS